MRDRLGRHLSSPLHEDTRTSAGVYLEKKARTMKISDIQSFERSPMDFQFKKTSFTPIRNYMRPTSCSDARKEKLQASPVRTDNKKRQRSSKYSYCLKSSSYSSSTVPSSPTAVKSLNRQFSLKSARSLMKKSSMTIGLCAKKNLNRATCSSTLKDSKFPAALVLDHGATEAQGSSKVRVCPYTYCSLNGQIHGTLPPLKSFISAKRKSLETLKNMKILDLFSVKTSENEEKNFDKEHMDVISEISSYTFVDIYTMPQEEIGADDGDEITLQDGVEHEGDCMFEAVADSIETVSQMNELSDISLGYSYDTDHISEFSQDEIDDFVMMNFHEDVEVDNEIKTQEGCEFEQYSETKNSDTEAMDIDGEEDQFLCNTVKSKEAEGDSGSKETNCHVTDKNDSVRSSSDLDSQSLLDEIQMPNQEGTETIAAQTLEHNEGVIDPKTSPSISTADKLEKELLEDIKGTLRTTSRKRSIEEFEQAKEFNPRAPNFLPVEPDPDAERVDLKHQMIDGRRSSEEWMVDYALQQALTKLGGPARKRKVALLVQAFETAVPPHVCEKSLSHGTSVFTHLSFIQACN